MGRRIILLVGCLSLLVTMNGCHYFLHHGHHTYGYHHPYRGYHHRGAPHRSYHYRHRG